MHFSSIVSFGLALIAPLASAQIQGQCHDLPIVAQTNPIAGRKNFITGTINETVIVLPIPMTTARSLIPSQYKILTKQIQAWAPGLAGQFPMILELGLFHDIYNKGVSAGTAGDFLRGNLKFPFVDRLGDGYSAFSYVGDAIISTSNTGAQTSYGLNGITIDPGFFAACNGYEYDVNATQTAPPAKKQVDQAAWTNVNPDFSNPDLAHRMLPTAGSPYSNNFYLNVTSQPVFSKGSGCDNLVRRLDTKISAGKYAPVAVAGEVAAMKSMYSVKTKTVWEGAWGLKTDWAYYETKNVNCKALKGFSVANAS